MDKKSDRCISQSARFECGYRFFKGRKRFFAWHGFWSKNDDYITISEINEDEFEEIYREYPTACPELPVGQRIFRNHCLSSLFSFIDAIHAGNVFLLQSLTRAAALDRTFAACDTADDLAVGPDGPLIASLYVSPEKVIK